MPWWSPFISFSKLNLISSIARVHEKGELGSSPAERTLIRRPFEPDPGNTGGGMKK
jgi:hypothetical protein